MFFVECTPQSKHRHALFQPLNSNFSQRRLGHPRLNDLGFLRGLLKHCKKILMDGITQEEKKVAVEILG
jgi:hypothetical protein